MTDQVTFEDLGLSEDILQGLRNKGFEIPTPIQAQTIPLLLKGEKDIIGQAQTGTGKTAAFGLPILERITPGKRRVQAIVVAPTRELAGQVAEELESLKANRDIRILPVYGGQGMDTQLRQLKSGVDIVVATPGRAIDHLKRKTLKLDEVQFVVLDEADEMLNMGFIEDIEEILSHCQEDRRMMLFSATMPSRIKKLAEKFMGDYDVVKVKTETESAENVEQVYYSVYERDKLRALRRLIDTEPEFYALVFSRTRGGADRLAEKLNSMGFDVAAMHGEVSQAQRERILAKFKKGHANILVATDVAARGIDISDLTHVINFDLPDNPESYVHRIGRTGRAGKSGKAISFVAPKDRHKIRQIMQLTKAPIEKLTLPSGQAVIDLKKRVIVERVHAQAEDEIPQEYHNLAKELMTSSEPEALISALLSMHFGKKLSPDSYGDLIDPDDKSSRSSFSSDSRRSGDRESYGGRDRRRGDRPERGERRSEGRGDRNRPERGERRNEGRGERSRPERGERRSEDRGDRNRPERGERRSEGRGERSRPERVERSSEFREDRSRPERGERRSEDRGERSRPERVERSSEFREDRSRPERGERRSEERKKFSAPPKDGFQKDSVKEVQEEASKQRFSRPEGEKKKFGKPEEGKKKFGKPFSKPFGKKEKIEGVGSSDKPKSKFKKKKAKIKAFG